MDDNDKGFAGILKRIPSYTKLLYSLYRDKDVNLKQKGFLSVGIAYSLSPVDLVPGIIPIAGQLDNIIVMLWSIKKALKAMDGTARERHLADTQLTMEIIEEDSENAKQMLKDIGKGAVRLSANGAKIIGYSAKNTFVRLTRRKLY